MLKVIINDEVARVDADGTAQEIISQVILTLALIVKSFEQDDPGSGQLFLDVIRSAIETDTIMEAANMEAD